MSSVLNHLSYQVLFSSPPLPTYAYCSNPTDHSSRDQLVFGIWLDGCCLKGMNLGNFVYMSVLFLLQNIQWNSESACTLYIYNSMQYFFFPRILCPFIHVEVSEKFACQKRTISSAKEERLDWGSQQPSVKAQQLCHYTDQAFTYSDSRNPEAFQIFTPKVDKESTLLIMWTGHQTGFILICCCSKCSCHYENKNGHLVKFMILRTCDNVTC